MEIPSLNYFSEQLNDIMKPKQTYIHRLIYTGVESFKKYPGVKGFFEEIVTLVNNQDPDEVLTGFLLYYEGHFVHIVEGSQETILRHLRRVYTAIKNGTALLGTMKVLISCHNVKQRFFKQWIGYTAKPSTLLEDLSTDANKESTWRHIKTCITKMYKLSAYLYQQTQTIQDMYCSATDLTSQSKNFPEVELLRFILGTKALLNLEDYTNTYFFICSRKSYHELIWPVQEDLVPYNILAPEENIFLCDKNIIKENVEANAVTISDKN